MFNIITQFEEKIAEFFGSPYAVSTDCCTHAIELSLLYTNAKTASVPTHTYLSVPMTIKKLNLEWSWKNLHWKDSYYLTENVCDAAVMWEKNSYVSNTFMCISFQYRKHLSLGRGGMILTDDQTAYKDLIKLGYDGRTREQPWADQHIDSIGYHYYMTPETATLGLEKLPAAINTAPKQWSWKDYPDLSTMSVFN